MIIDNKTDSLVDEILNPNSSAPLVPSIGTYKTNSKGYRYYMNIREQLPEWWEEFNSALDEKGGQKHRTIAKFIKAKTNKVKEQFWLMAMLGPEPELIPNQKPEVPWLGDWYRRRLNNAYLPEQLAKMKSVNQAIIRQTNILKGMEPIVVQVIARHLKWHEQVDQAFGNQLFDYNRGPMDNKDRVEFLTQLHNRIDLYTFTAFEEIMKLEGIAQNNGVTINTQVNQGQPITNQSNQLLSPQVQTLAQMTEQLMYHSARMNLPLPASLVPKKVEPVDEIKSEKKEKVQ